jgi:hypothetical protein
MKFTNESLLQRMMLFSDLLLIALFLLALAEGKAEASGAQQPKAATHKAVSSSNTTPAAPAGWQVIRDHDGKCQISIPGEWTAVAGFGMASSTKLKGRAAVQKDSESNWNELKQTAKSILKPTTVFEESASLLYFEYSIVKGKGFYTARPYGRYSCIAQVDFDSAETAEKYSTTAKQMVESVGKAH